MATIETTDDVTAAWLDSVLTSPSSPPDIDAGQQGVETRRIGTGQVSETYSVTYRKPQGTQKAVIKLASSNQTSRASAKQLGLYEREVLFYQKVAPHLPNVIPKCYAADFDATSNSCALLLEDAGPTLPGLDDLKGASLDEAKLALATLGKLHHSLLSINDADLSWLKREPSLNQAILSQLFMGYSSRYRDKMDPRHLEVCATFVSSFAKSTEAQNSADFLRGPIHGDYRLDNLLFGMPDQGAPRSLSVVDWQTFTYGGLMGEVAYFLGCSVPLELRRAHLDELLETYLTNLNESSMTPERAKLELAAQAFFGVVMGIASPMMVVQTERGDAMFMAMMARHCELVLDLGSLDLLPRSEGAPAALLPQPDDEFLHVKGTEDLWNESLYFDFVDKSQEISGWLRLGLTPNLEANNWIMMMSQHNQKTVIGIHDDHAPAPGGDRSTVTVKTDRYTASHTVKDPLKQYHISVNATATVFEDETAAMAQDITTHPAKPQVPVVLDLLWNTSGVPYQYKITTRYEVPCKVSGSIVIGDRKIHLQGAPGQRDHSHGVRDWWSMNWMWSAVHLDDGTQLHAVELRIPGRPSMGVGYAQKDLKVEELEQVETNWTFDQGEGQGLVKHTAMILTFGEQKLEISVTPQQHAPVKLVAPDGRVSDFDRAWCVVKDSIGREGVAWCEWNSPVDWTR